MKEYQNDPLFYIPLLSLKLHDAKIIIENEKYLQIDDKTAQIYYILLFSKDVDFDLLIKNASQYEATISIASKYELNLKQYQFSHLLICRQFTYTGKGFDINVDYKICEVTKDDFEYLFNHYYRMGRDKEYIINAINRGMLKAEKNNRIVAFIGEHPEHTMGLLYVDESYRRQGIGRNLEYALINKFLKENKRPIDHVVITNFNSQSLQNSIPDMRMDDGYFYWYF